MHRALRSAHTERTTSAGVRRSAMRHTLIAATHGAVWSKQRPGAISPDGAIKPSRFGTIRHAAALHGAQVFALATALGPASLARSACVATLTPARETRHSVRAICVKATWAGPLARPPLGTSRLTLVLASTLRPADGA
jgi:hypothetical protein